MGSRSVIIASLFVTAAAVIIGKGWLMGAHTWVTGKVSGE